MLLAFDTYYFDNKAKTVCLAFDRWTASDNFTVYTEIREDIEDYKPGEFYKRELPCIISLLEKIPYRQAEAIVVDGFVVLDDNNKPGLGAHLNVYLQGTIPIIGVAKNNFATIEKNKRVLLRGESEKPLYITSVGIDVDKAAALIRSMSGDFRIPTLLKHLDMLTKETGPE